MANEYLQRTPTSTGNRKVWTISVWIKLSNTSSTSIIRTSSSGTSAESGVYFNSSRVNFEYYNGPGQNYYQTESPLRRDFSSWSHVLVSCDSTKVDLENERTIIYVNGVRTSSLSADAPLPFNTDTFLNLLGRQVNIGSRPVSSADQFFQGEMCDFFFIDGQALTPDVFGFNKSGKGYVSAGSTQSTDFRPGQWVPKTPRVIKTAINNSGGFGVNGFYLPMNDSNNFGADFHGTPNSIIKLQENLPQPRCRIDGVGDYTGALRDDPFKQYLVLALPFVSGGLQSGFGDYSAVIKGSGSAKTLVWNSGSVTPSIGNTGVYYGSGGNFPGGTVGVSTSADFKMDGSFTVESWFFSNSFNSSSGNHIVQYRNGLAGSDNWVLSQGGTGGGSIRFLLRNDNGTNAADLDITSTGITTNQWYHFAGVYNDTNKTSTVYLNGVTIGISTNISWTRNNGTTLLIGSNSNGPTGAVGDRNINGYLQDLRIYKGVAKYTGGFDVPRPYTPVGIATWRAVPDTTANNFATLNPLIEARPSSGTNSPSSSTIVTFAGGNLDLTNSASAGNAQRMYSFATIGISTGRWYWEVRAGSNDAVAITKGFQQLNYAGVLGSGSGLEASVAYYGGGSVSVANTAYYSTATTLTPPTFDTTNIIGIAVSANSGLNNLTVQWFKDGVGVSTLTGIGATSRVLEWFPSRIVSSSGSGGDTKYNFGQNPSFSGNTTAGTFTDTNGKGLFKYEPPSGFLALCEDNLPTPAISDPGKYFRTVLYTGDGASGRSIVGVGFTPDLVWVKLRNTTGNHSLYDAIRGAGQRLSSSLTNAEATFTNSITSFDSTGFSLGSNSDGDVNSSGNTYVAWCWKAGAGTTSTNTNGSITSVVSVNQDAGFSIVSYTGTGANATVGHGLGKVPKMVIIKQRSLSGYSWVVYHSGLTNANYYVALESTIAQTSVPALFNGTAPTSSVFSVGTETAVSGTGNNIIAYCWAEIEGYSKFGSYVGNSSTDGVFVYTGFRPAWVMIKRTDSTDSWAIFDSSRDSTNPVERLLRAESSNAEATMTSLVSNPFGDLLSNGFKVRNTSTIDNVGSYIFVAFAESPFQTANAK